jgi:type III pantothenate kinase
MKVAVVADVGNTRIKWGLCSEEGISATAALPPDDPSAWQQRIDSWRLTGLGNWAVSGVHPPRCDRLVDWLRQRGHGIVVVDTRGQLPIGVNVRYPDRVGIDRLLNVVAAVRHSSRGRVPAIIVDAGSAVTVDWVNDKGYFGGGSIFPGLQMMSQALHDHTALLPLVHISWPSLALPGLSTEQAIATGVYSAVVGGINTLIQRLSEGSEVKPHVFLTGGDAPLLSFAVTEPFDLWPEMTLEGIRLTAEAQP